MVVEGFGMAFVGCFCCEELMVDGLVAGVCLAELTVGGVDEDDRLLVSEADGVRFRDWDAELGRFRIWFSM